MLKLYHTAFLQVCPENNPGVPPKFTSRLPEETVVAEGKPLELTCSISAEPTPTVTWYKNERSINNYPPYEISFDKGVATLRIRMTEPGDSGSYKCVASNPNGTVTSTAEVMVKGKIGHLYYKTNWLIIVFVISKVKFKNLYEFGGAICFSKVS